MGLEKILLVLVVVELGLPVLVDAMFSKSLGRVVSKDAIFFKALNDSEDEDGVLFTVGCLLSVFCSLPALSNTPVFSPGEASSEY